jgi:uncharacterized membrane protein
MFVILLSLLSAFFFACHSVSVKGGMNDSNPMSATLISSLINAIFLWVVTILFVPFNILVSRGSIYLVVAGLLAPSLARLFLYTGIEKVGVSRASPIKETAQFVTAFAAILVLGEHITAAIGIATVLTVFGVVLLSSSSDNGKTTPNQLQWKRKDLLFPFGAALLYGLSRVFRKLGMITITSSWGGATLIATISLLFFFILIPFIKKKQRLKINKRSFLFFASGGMLAGLGQVCVLAALKSGDVVVVSPLISTTPLFALSLTYVFLKKFERITLQVVLGAIIIVTAVIILSTMS